MKYQCVLSEETVDDINDIFSFDEYKFGHKQAINYLVGLEEHFEKLRIDPTIGRERNDIEKVLYSLPYSSHIISHT